MESFNIYKKFLFFLKTQHICAFLFSTLYSSQDAVFFKISSRSTIPANRSEIIRENEHYVITQDNKNYFELVFHEESRSFFKLNYPTPSNIQFNDSNFDKYIYLLATDFRQSPPSNDFSREDIESQWTRKRSRASSPSSLAETESLASTVILNSQTDSD